MFDWLDFVYLPSRDVAGDLRHFTDRVGAERRPVRARPARADLELAMAGVVDRGVEIGSRFEILHGPGVELVCPGPQRLALYELTRPDAAQRLADRGDF